MTQLELELPGGVLEEVVTRWIEHRGGPLDDVVPRITGSAFRLDRPFTRSSQFAHPTWIGHGRVVPDRGFPRRATRIELTITAWSDDVAEVTVRRSGRRLLAWGRTKEHRYFARAHLAAEQVSDAIVAGGMLAEWLPASRS